MRKPVMIAAVTAVLLVPTGLALGPYVELPHLSFGDTVTDTQSVPLLIAIRNISQYHAATGRFQTLAERDTDGWGPDFLNSEHVAIYAVGDVDAEVDFGQVTADSVETNPERTRVTITLPAPTLTPVQLDPLETKVVDDSRGLVQRISGAVADVPEQHRDLLVEASGKLNEAARRSDLVARGETSTRDMLTGLCQSLGYTDVTIKFDPVVPPKG